jgi:hypothetical protein
MPQQKTTIQLKPTGAQKAQIRAATGRNVSVLELRLHDWLKARIGREGAAEPQFPTGSDGESSPEPAAGRVTGAPIGIGPSLDDQEG